MRVIGFFLGTLLCLISLTSPEANAAAIQKIRDTTVLISLEGMEVEEGDSLFAVDSGGKKRALIEITKVKGEKAIGKIKKGKAQEGYEVIAKGGTPKGGEGGGEESKSGLRIGGYLGYGIDAMSVKVNSQTRDTTGTSIGLGVLANMQWSPGFGARGWFGIKPWKTTKANTVGAESKIEIQYIDMAALARFSLGSSSDFWAGAGMGFLVPMSSSSNLLDSGSISSTATVDLAVGYDVSVGKMKIPIMAFYKHFLFLSGSDTTASSMGLQVGAFF